MTAIISPDFLDHIQPHLPENCSLETFVAFCQKPLRRSIRINTLKISVAAFKQRVEPRGWQLTPIPWCETGFWLARPADEESQLPLGNTGEHLLGLFYIQEASSMMPPTALFSAEDSQGFATVLDMAAAPGSKTTQMAALMNNHGMLVANELSSSRLKGLYSNIERCGISNTALTHYDGCLFGDMAPEQFDAILLDAPCSGEGTVRKDPEALKQWDSTRVHELAELQERMLKSAIEALKPGGCVVYSTCTLNPYENEQVCQRVLEHYQGQVVMEPLLDLFEGADNAQTDGGALHIWPHIFDSEGFFVARLRKVSATREDRRSQSKLGKFPFSHCQRTTAQQLQSYLNAQFGFTLSPEDGELYQRGKELWLFPAQLSPLVGKLRFDRIGVKVAEIFGSGVKQGFRLEHQFALAFGAQFSANQVTLAPDNAASLIQGKDVELTTPPKQATGEQLVMFEQWPLGLGKVIRNRLKNNLPRNLVREKPNFAGS